MTGSFVKCWERTEFTLCPFFLRLADASLDKNTGNGKIKAEDDGKSSYEQVIDELAELLRERKHGFSCCGCGGCCSCCILY